MYFADDIGTPLFKLLTAPTDLARVLFIFGLLFLALMALLTGILLLVRKKALRDSAPDQVFEDPFNSPHDRRS